jgi:hypothetical protein
MTNLSSGTRDDVPIFCARCAAELHPGTDGFYLIRIEAVADPTPPDISEEDLQTDIQSEIKELLAQMEKMSATEAMDQVHRRLIIYLCGRCYPNWIENPAGKVSSH